MLFYTIVKVVMAFCLGVLTACLLGCTATIDWYYPTKKGTYADRQLVHDRQQGIDNLAYFNAWRDDQGRVK
tara:strand:- start:13420 stop:13632 length:213 start_codon:yes stop_codon:yes gene_type:complete